MAQLDGRVAIVTGAVQGIGLGVALSMARAGANIVVADMARMALPPLSLRSKRRAYKRWGTDRCDSSPRN